MPHVRTYKRALIFRRRSLSAYRATEQRNGDRTSRSNVRSSRGRSSWVSSSARRVATCPRTRLWTRSQAMCSPTTCPSASTRSSAVRNGRRARVTTPSVPWGRGWSRPTRSAIRRTLPGGPGRPRTRGLSYWRRSSWSVPTAAWSPAIFLPTNCSTISTTPLEPYAEIIADLSDDEQRALWGAKPTAFIVSASISRSPDPTIRRRWRRNSPTSRTKDRITSCDNSPGRWRR